MTPLEGMIAGVGVGFAFMVARTIYLRLRGGSDAKAPQGKRARKR